MSEFYLWNGAPFRFSSSVSLNARTCRLFSMTGEHIQENIRVKGRWSRGMMER